MSDDWEEAKGQERKVQRLEGLLNIYRVGLVAALIVIVILLGLLKFGKSPRYARAILINSKVAAFVTDERAATTVRQRLLAEGKKAGAGQATFEEKWEDVTRAAGGQQILSPGEAVRVLRPKVTVLVEAFAIEVNGLQLIVVPTRDVAEGVLNRLKQRYASQSDAVVTAKKLTPEPIIRPTTAPPAEVVGDVLEAVEHLATARARPETYIVKPGDYAEQIASLHRMSGADFWRINPTLRGQTLQPGQRVRVLSDSAGLVVVTVKEAVTTEEIAPPVVKLASASLPRGQTKLSDPGRPGRKRVRWQIVMHDANEVSRKPLNEEFLAKPEPQHLMVGTGPAVKTN
jgi:hypothetical protein